MQAVRQSQTPIKAASQEESKCDRQGGNSSYLLRQSSLLSKNEVKVLFKPYTRDDLQKILSDLFVQHM